MQPVRPRVPPGRRVALPPSLGLRRLPPPTLRAASLWIGLDARLAYRRGVGAYVARLVEALARLETSHRFTVFHAPAELRRRVASPRFSFEDPGPTPRGVRVPAWEQVLLPRAAWHLGLDLLHYVDNTGPAFAAFPFVLTVHDTWTLRPLCEVRPRASPRDRLAHAYRRWCLPRAAHRARLVLVPSRHTKTSVQRDLSLPASRIRVTSEGLALGAPLRRTRRLRRRRNFRILVHATADRRKNLEGALAAARILRDGGIPAMLEVVGMGEREIRESGGREAARALGLEDCVRFRGYVPEEELRRLYEDCALMLFLSREEGFGLPVLEAFAAGLPVVCARAGALPEVAGGAVLYADPEDAAGAASAAARILASPALARRLAALGRRRLRRFQWEHTARLTLRAYEEAGGVR